MLVMRLETVKLLLAIMVEIMEEIMVASSPTALHQALGTQLQIHANALLHIAGSMASADFQANV